MEEKGGCMKDLWDFESKSRLTNRYFVCRRERDSQRYYLCQLLASTAGEGSGDGVAKTGIIFNSIAHPQLEGEVEKGSNWADLLGLFCHRLSVAASTFIAGLADVASCENFPPSQEELHELLWTPGVKKCSHQKSIIARGLKNSHLAWLGYF